MLSNPFNCTENAQYKISNAYAELETLYQDLRIMNAALTKSQLADMFRPPVNHAMKILDRSFFQKEVSLAAARVLENKHISRLRADLHLDILNLERVNAIKNDPTKHGFKSLLLRPEIRADGISISPFRALYDLNSLTLIQMSRHGARSFETLSMLNRWI